MELYLIYLRLTDMVILELEESMVHLTKNTCNNNMEFITLLEKDIFVVI